MLPFYPRTLKSHFQAYVDAIVAAPAEDSITALLPKEREVLLLMVQLCAALIHLQRHHVVHRDIKVCGCGSVSLAQAGLPGSSHPGCTERQHFH